MIFFDRLLEFYVESFVSPIFQGMNCIESSKYTLFYRNLPKSANGLRAVLLSDLHNKCYGKNERKLYDKIVELRPDVVFMTGDMISHDFPRMGSFLRFVKDLSGEFPVFYVNGNHECSDLTESEFLRYNAEMKKCGAVCLDNRSEIFRDMRIYGVCYDAKFYRGVRNHKFSFSEFSVSDMNFYCKKKSSEGFSVLLAHNPADFETYAKWGADLTLSGHIHGGFLRLPIIGGILSPELKLFPKYQSGVYKKNSRKLVVSRGLGRIRVLNRPEIISITLKKR